MALVPSTMLPLGTSAPDFDLFDGDGARHCLADFAGAPALLVMFICNHCPYVEHIKPALASLAQDYEPKGLAVVAINANDPDAYPADAPDRMVADARTFGYAFPYLFDGTQTVAKAYHAACTPDFFLFDGDRRLVYRGQFDDSRPGNGKPVTGADLRAAIAAVLGGNPVESAQNPSVGCNIKWRGGVAPEYTA